MIETISVELHHINDIQPKERVITQPVQQVGCCDMCDCVCDCLCKIVDKFCLALCCGCDEDKE